HPDTLRARGEPAPARRGHGQEEECVERERWRTGVERGAVGPLTAVQQQLGRHENDLEATEQSRRRHVAGHRATPCAGPVRRPAGFEAPSAGEILMDDRPVTGASRDRGVVFQGDDSLYGWLTAVENVEFGLRMRRVPRSERRRRALEFLDLVGLAGQADKYPSE